MSEDGKLVGRIVWDAYGRPRKQLERDRPRGIRFEPFDEDGGTWDQDIPWTFYVTHFGQPVV